MASLNSDLSVLADRYTEALYELCEEKKATSRVAKELQAILEALKESSDLARLFASPVLSREDQIHGLRGLMSRFKMHKITTNYLLTLAHNRRLACATQLIEAFLSGLAVRRGEITAHVTTARKLTAAELKSLESEIGAALNGRVHLEVRQDPELLGGLVIQVGSQMVDSSLRSKLVRLRMSMKENS